MVFQKLRQLPHCEHRRSLSTLAWSLALEAEMKRLLATAVICGGFAVAAMADDVSRQTQAPVGARGDTQAWIEQNLKGWPEGTKEVAKKVMTSYGQPDEIAASMLVWHKRGPWKRTILHREEVAHNFPMPHKDVLEQFIDYRVPPDKFDDLANYDGSVLASRTTGELSARCDKEGANFLAINLANDIVTGKKSVDEARKHYSQAVEAMMKGEMQPYLTGLQFTPKDTATADADRPTLRGMVQGRTPPQ
jgi:hypothetical protein